MTLDAEAAGFLRRYRDAGAPRFETLTPREARAIMDAARRGTQSPPVQVKVEDIWIETTGVGSVAARLYQPTGHTRTRACMVFFHGGGWVLGGLDSHDALCGRIAEVAGCSVLAIDYPRSPEHKFPVAVECALEVVTWACRAVEESRIDADLVGVGGDSAGGNLAAVAARAAARGEIPRIGFQLLFYPVVDLTSSWKSPEQDLSEFPVSDDTLAWFRDHYLGSADQAADVRASPLLDDVDSDLPPTYILSAGHDPLLDEVSKYAAKLTTAGVPVRYLHCDGQFHAFLTMGPDFAATDAVIREVGSWMRSLSTEGRNG